MRTNCSHKALVFSRELFTGTNYDDNMRYFGSNVTIDAGNGNDSILSGASDMDYSANSVGFVTGGDGNDSINNLDFSDNVSINGGAGNDNISNRYSNKVSIIGGNGNDFIENSNSSDTSISGGGGNDTILNWNESDNATINGDTGDDSITSYANNTSINGGSGDDIINNRVYSNASIMGGTGDDTIYASGKKQFIQYANGDGHDIIYYYQEDDTIQIAGSSYSTMISGEDLIINVGDGTMTLKDAANQTINIISSNTVEPIDDNDDSDTDNEIVSPIDLTSKKGIKFNNAETKIAIDKKFEDSAVDLSSYSKLRTIDASKVNKNFEITANDKNNTIKGGKQSDIINGDDGNDIIRGNTGNDELNGEDGNDKLLGGNGNDTLNGGDGNDTLTGGKGNDNFVFESDSGADIITDYESGKDAIMLDDDIEAVTVKGKNVILIVGDNSLTIKKAKGKQIAFVDDDGEYTYQTFKKSVTFNDDDDDDERNFVESDYWFAADDNFINDDLHSIVKVDSINCSINNLDTVNAYDFTDLTNSTQKSTAVTYSELDK